jgi:predicted DNA-binding transcriptional regulator AlpA
MPHESKGHNMDVSDLPELATDVEVAKVLQLKAGTLRNWRIEGKGPRWIKIGTYAVRYRRSDLAAWLESR